MKKVIYVLIALVTLGMTSCAECENPPTCKFQKGDLVQDKTSRWAKKGAIVDTYVTSDCECRYTVSNTTWIEGKTKRDMSEYELEEAGHGIDLDAMDVLKELF